MASQKKMRRTVYMDQPTAADGSPRRLTEAQPVWALFLRGATPYSYREGVARAREKGKLLYARLNWAFGFGQSFASTRRCRPAGVPAVLPCCCAPLLPVRRHTLSCRLVAVPPSSRAAYCQAAMLMWCGPKSASVRPCLRGLREGETNGSSRPWDNVASSEAASARELESVCERIQRVSSSFRALMCELSNCLLSDQSRRISELVPGRTR